MFAAQFLLALAVPTFPWTPSVLPMPAWTQQVTPRPTLDDACRIVFDVLVGEGSESSELLDAAFPTVAEMQALYDADLVSASASARALALEDLKQRGGIAAVRAEALALFRTRLDTARGAVVGRFNWSEATYLCAMPLEQPARRIGGTAFEVARAEFLVAARGEVWSFGANDVLHGPRGWAFTEFVSFRGPRSLPDPSARNSEYDARRIAELEEELDRARRENRELVGALEQRKDGGDVTANQLAESRAEVAWLRERMEAMHHEIVAQQEQFALAMNEQRSILDETRAQLAEALDGEQAHAIRLEFEKQRHRLTEEEHDFTREMYAKELLHAHLVRDALQFAVGRLEVHLGAAVAARADDTGAAVGESPEGARIPEWLAPSAGEPAWRSALRRELSNHVTASYGEVPVQWIVDYVRLASGIGLVLLPSIAIDADIRYAVFECEGAPMFEVLTHAVAPSLLRIHAGVVFVGTADELALLGRPLLAASSDADGPAHPGDGDAAAADTVRAKLSQVCSPFKVHDVLARDLVQFVEVVTDVAIWPSTAAMAWLGDASLHLDAPRGLNAETLLLLVLQRCELQAALIDGVVVIDVPDAEPMAPLEPAVRAGLAAEPEVIELNDQAIEDLLALLSARFGVELGLAAAAREALSDLEFPASHLPRAPLPFVLRAIQHDLRGYERVRWVRAERGLELTLE